jgi:hypothetical protein
MVMVPRVKKSKATKIAYKILGKPANISFVKKGKLKDIDKRIQFENTQRVR